MGLDLNRPPDCFPKFQRRMPVNANTLQDHRAEAALASQGTSARAIHDALLEQAARFQRHGLKKLLDFGAGTGELAAAFVGQGLFDEVHAVDLVPYPGARLEKITWHYADLNDRLGDFDAPFDAIFAAEVIEHLENPRALAREWFRLLKPGGWVACSTPNNESWRAILSLIGRGHYVAFGPSNYPAHITPMLAIDLTRVLQEAGFESVEIKYTNFGSLPKFTSRTWQQVSGGLLRGRRFSDNVIAVARKPGHGDF